MNVRHTNQPSNRRAGELLIRRGYLKTKPEDYTSPRSFEPYGPQKEQRGRYARTLDWVVGPLCRAKAQSQLYNWISSVPERHDTVRALVGRR